MSAIVLDTELRATIADMIRRAFSPYAAKIAARYADANHRTVEDWLQGRTSPSAVALLRMCRHHEFRALVRAYLDTIEAQERGISVAMDALQSSRADLLRDRLAKTRPASGSKGQKLPAHYRSAARMTVR